MSFDGTSVDAQGPGKSLYGGEKALLQTADQQPRGCLRSARLAGKPALPQLPILIEKPRELEFRGVIGKPVEIDLLDAPFREATGDLPQIILETAHQDSVEIVLQRLDAPAKPLRIEDLQESRKAVRVPVVRRGRKEQPVLEAGG